MASTKLLLMWYLIPGLGADERVFRGLRLPGPAVVLPWLVPQSPTEPLRHYAARLAEAVPLHQPCWLVGVSFGGLLALASDGSKTRVVDFNTIYASDPSVYTLSPVARPGELWDIAWANGLWVACGNGGKIHTSTDGDLWTTRQLEGSALKWLAGGSDGWIACEEGTGYYWYSADGASWERHEFGGAFFPISIAWGGGKWVASSTTGTRHSSDGQNWTTSTGDASWVYSAAWTGSRWRG
ncbi:MAG: hypothetical protein EOO63_15015, partial [Hymenobacter sp.]